MFNVFTKVAFILLIFLLVANVFAYVLFATSDHVITFSEFLDRINDAPQIELSLSESVEIFSMSVSESDLAIVQFFKNIINALGSVLGLIVWVGSLLINLVSIIGYLLYLFGVASFSSFI